MDRGAAGTLLMVPPTFSRLPPDGHEFPPNFSEPIVSKNSLNLDQKSSTDGDAMMINNNLKMR